VRKKDSPFAIKAYTLLLGDEDMPQRVVQLTLGDTICARKRRVYSLKIPESLRTVRQVGGVIAHKFGVEGILALDLNGYSLLPCSPAGIIRDGDEIAVEECAASDAQMCPCLECVRKRLQISVRVNRLDKTDSETDHQEAILVVSSLKKNCSKSKV
jgi:hypothetical protein